MGPIARGFLFGSAIGCVLGVLSMPARGVAQTATSAYDWADLESIDDGEGTPLSHDWMTVGTIPIVDGGGVVQVRLQARYGECEPPGRAGDCSDDGGYPLEIASIVGGQEGTRAPIYRWRVDERGGALGRVRPIGHTQVVLQVWTFHGDVDLGEGASEALQIEWDPPARHFRVVQSERVRRRGPRWLNQPCDQTFRQDVERRFDAYLAEHNPTEARLLISSIAPTCMPERSRLERRLPSSESTAVAEGNGRLPAPAARPSGPLDTRAVIVGTWQGAGGATETFYADGICVYAEGPRQMVGRYRWIGHAVFGRDRPVTSRVMETTYQGVARRWMIAFQSPDDYFVVSDGGALTHWRRVQ